MTRLALLGGSPVLQAPLPPYRPIGSEEASAVHRVMQSGELSGFVAEPGEGFRGGHEVRALEAEWADYFGAAFAVSVNSNTSGLIAALGAIGLEPGDEVIVSPWTMSASATAILVWNAIPVFADIEDATFNLDPARVEASITPRTRALVVPDIFGHPAAFNELRSLADRHGLALVEDAAQAPGATYHGRFAGTLADVGVFSLNYHKHIHTGEGGVCVTDDPDIAHRISLIRNHAEVAIGTDESDLANMIGFNFRLTEIQAAIGREQLKKLDRLVTERVGVAEHLGTLLQALPGLQMPVVRPNCTHSYYVFGMRYDPTMTGVPRDMLVDALRAEGVPAAARYQNLHLLPMYQQRIAYGRQGFPWRAPTYDGEVSYEKGICPVAEGLQDETYVGVGMCSYQYDDRTIKAMSDAFSKVWEEMPALQAESLRSP